MSKQTGTRSGPSVVLVQERRTLVREGLALLVDADDGLQLAATAATGPELIELTEATPCDVAALELWAEDWDVEEVVAAVRSARPEVRVAGLHAGRRGDQMKRARRLGVEWLVSYDEGGNAAIAALRGSVRPLHRPAVERRTQEQLTEREREVLADLCAGLTTAESGESLRLSARTVEHHRRRIFAKLGAQNQAHAVSIAHRLGLLRSHSVGGT